MPQAGIRFPGTGIIGTSESMNMPNWGKVIIKCRISPPVYNIVTGISNRNKTKATSLAVSAPITPGITK